MQKLATKNQISSAPGTGMNLRLLVDQQKTSSKIRKSSGNRVLVMQEQGVKSNKADKQQKKVLTQKPTQFQLEASFVKVKVKKNSKFNVGSLRQDRQNSDLFTGSELIQKKVGFDYDDGMKVEEYNSSQSPKYQNEYTLMGGGVAGATCPGININDENPLLEYEEDYQEIDQEIKMPTFLGRASLDPQEKNQFYMTQILNQSRQSQVNPIMMHPVQSSSNVTQKFTKSVVSTQNQNSNSKMFRQKQHKQTVAKKSQIINKSSLLIKGALSNGGGIGMPKAQISPQTEHHHQQQFILPSTYAEFGHLSKITKNSKSSNKRSVMNTSALLNHSKDFMNTTAPLNMNQLNINYKEDPILCLSEAMNSTSNINRIGSKETSAKEQQQQNISSYYSGVTTTNMARGSNQSMSPVKIAKKQLLIQNILKQDQQANQFKQQPNDGNSKFFLNLTIQQLIQQQQASKLQAKQGQLSSENPSRLNQKRDQNHHQPQGETNAANAAIGTHDSNPSSINKQKRLNKTLDSFKNQQQNHQQQHLHNQQLHGNPNNMQQNPTQILCLDQKVRQSLAQYQPQSIGMAMLPTTKGSKTQPKNSAAKIKFSNTMKISDFNATQNFDIATGKAVNNPNQLQPRQTVLSSHEFNSKASKSSLRSTMNLKNAYDNIATNATGNLIAASAQPKEKKGSGAKKGTYKNVACSGGFEGFAPIYASGANLDLLTNQKNHRRQGSQDKELIQKILNFCQDDFLQQFEATAPVSSVIPQSNPVNIEKQNKRTRSNIGLRASQIQQMQQQNIPQQQLQTKHKANSTLNCYLQKKLNNHTLLALQEQQNPYAVIDQEEKRSSSYLKKEHIKELQNKTQPIPKSLLDLTDIKYAATGAQQNFNPQKDATRDPRFGHFKIKSEYKNLSTGTSIIANKIPSRDSLGRQSKKTKNSRSRTQNKILEDKDKVGNEQAQQPYETSQTEKRHQRQSSQQVQQPQPQITASTSQQKPKVGKRRDIEIAKTNYTKEDDPNDVYNNKNTVILDEIYPEGSSQCDQQEESQCEASKLDRFVFGKQIGQGAYAIVRVATCKKDNKKYAIKIYDKSKLTDSNRQKSVRREIKLLQKMNHPNIVKIFEAFETDHHVYLVMEYVGGGSLYSYLKERANRRLEEEEAKRIFKQIITALQYCHRKSIAHRDIKLENILLDEDQNVKLIDFGFSTCIPNDKKIKMFCGTPSYMAPEIVMKEEYAGPPADIWASAVLLYALMNGCFPFRGTTDKELYRRIQRGTFVMHNENASSYILELLAKMLNIIADDRPSADEVLSDEWFDRDTTKEPTQKEKAESIADQKKQFKAKILGKIPVEKTKNTICLNSSQEHIRNLQFGRGTAGSNLNFCAGSNYQACATGAATNANTDFSDYGIQQQNAMRKLNQEAYQAYYNTSGGNLGLNGVQAIQNPYYNNFFQNNNFNFVNNPQHRSSPNKGANPQIHTSFPLNFNQQPTQQQQQHYPGQIGTPQVFGSPTGFHCQGGIINNNFNIINNITQVTCLSPSGQPGINLQQHPMQAATSHPPTSEFTAETKAEEAGAQEFEMKMNLGLELDEEIVNSLTKLGYHKSHVVSQLENNSSHISHLSAKLKEEKMSQTQNNRPTSLQPQKKYYSIGRGQHNNGIFPAFVPSIPESLKCVGGCGQAAGEEAIVEGGRQDNELNNYYEQNDYVVISPAHKGARPKISV